MQKDYKEKIFKNGGKFNLIGCYSFEPYTSENVNIKPKLIYLEFSILIKFK